MAGMARFRDQTLRTGLLVVAGLAVSEGRALACFQWPDCFEPPLSIEIAADGAVVLDTDQQLGTIELNDSYTASATRDGLPIAGTLALTDTTPPWVVWRPGVPLAAGDEIALHIEHIPGFQCGIGAPATVDITVEVLDQLVAPPPPPIVEPAIETWEQQQDRMLCCNHGADSCGPNIRCVGENRRDMPHLRWTHAENDGEDPLEREFIREYYVGVDGEAKLLLRSELDAEDSSELHHRYDELGQEYCLRVDYVRVADDSRLSYLHCSDAPGDDWPVASNDLDGFDATCESGAYWEDDGSSYEPQAADSGSGDDGGEGNGGEDDVVPPWEGDETGGGANPGAGEPATGGCRFGGESPLALLLIPLAMLARRDRNTRGRTAQLD